jgi:hypothetical protein
LIGKIFARWRPWLTDAPKLASPNMKVTPIIMSAAMVRALLEGRKIMTRRLNGLEDVNKYPDAWNHASLVPLDYMAKPSARGKYGATFRSKSGAIEEYTISICPAACPYGGPRDYVWVRESGKLDKESKGTFI